MCYDAYRASENGRGAEASVDQSYSAYEIRGILPLVSAVSSATLDSSFSLGAMNLNTSVAPAPKSRAYHCMIFDRRTSFLRASTATVPLRKASAAKSSCASILFAEYALMGGHAFAPQFNAK